MGFFEVPPREAIPPRAATPANATLERVKEGVEPGKGDHSHQQLFGSRKKEGAYFGSKVCSLLKMGVPSRDYKEERNWVGEGP